jgi:predicted ArsR family transcriptional regulator
MAGRKETVSDEEILRLFEESSDPFLTTSEVADELGFSNHGARKRLYRLAEEGELEFKRVGNAPAWWQPKL